MLDFLLGGLLLLLLLLAFVIFLLLLGVLLFWFLLGLLLLILLLFGILLWLLLALLLLRLLLLLFLAGLGFSIFGLRFSGLLGIRLVLFLLPRQMLTLHAIPTLRYLCVGPICWPYALHEEGSKMVGSKKKVPFHSSQSVRLHS